jgi:hypothetical protein
MNLMYKFPGVNLLEDGNKYDWREFANLEDGEDQGWSATYWDAKAKFDAAAIDESKESQPLSRVELEKLATEAGIKFDGRTSDKTLNEKVAEWATQKSNS